MQQRTIDDVRLPGYVRWPILAIALGIFLFLGATPVWERPFDIDLAIWRSYAPIPVLVLVGLLLTRQIGAVSLFLNTLELVLTKFAITYMIAIPLWAMFERPAVAAPTLTPVAVAQAAPTWAVTPTPWPEDERGDVAGVVETEEGRPKAGAFVFVSAGLDDMYFASPSRPLEWGVGATGFTSPLFVARTFTPLHVRSEDTKLHALAFGSDRAIPALPSGEPAIVDVSAHQGIVPVHCTVHGEAAHAAVLHHPHVTVADARGVFVLRDVPARAVTVTAWTQTSLASLSAPITAGETVSVTLRLQAHR